MTEFETLEDDDVTIIRPVHPHCAGCNRPITYGEGCTRQDCPLVQWESLNVNKKRRSGGIA